MFIVLLKFTGDKSNAPALMPSHNEWIERGFTDRVFLMVGSIGSGAGGAILAHDTTLPELQKRVSEDPLVEHRVVSAEILEIDPHEADPRLRFLVKE